MESLWKFGSMRLGSESIYISNVLEYGVQGIISCQVYRLSSIHASHVKGLKFLQGFTVYAVRSPAFPPISNES